MSNYTEEMQSEIERVTLKGNADKFTISKLSSIIWQLDQRIITLEKEVRNLRTTAVTPETKTEASKTTSTKASK